MTFAKITQAAHYVPENVVSNDDLSKIMDTNDEWIYSRTGIKNRHISTGENTSDLATKVAKFNFSAKSGGASINQQHLFLLGMQTLTSLVSLYTIRDRRIQTWMRGNKLC